VFVAVGVGVCVGVLVGVGVSVGVTVVVGVGVLVGVTVGVGVLVGVAVGVGVGVGVGVSHQMGLLFTSYKHARSILTGGEFRIGCSALNIILAAIPERLTGRSGNVCVAWYRISPF